MKGRENFNMETTTFSERRGVTLSRTSVVILSIIFLGSLGATGYLLYKLSLCSNVWHHSHHDKHHHNSNNNSTSLINSERSPTNTVANQRPIGTSTNGSSNILSFSPNANDLLPMVRENVRLPRSLKPLAYDLKLIPFMFEKNFTFDGDVKILFEVLDDCDNITLHAEALKILDDNVEVRLHQNTTNQTLQDAGKVGKKKQYFVEAKQFYVIEVNQTLKKGSIYELMIRFTGVLNDYLQGFYRSSYSDGKNVRWLATTQFQPTDARRAFPCFDEPALKATFNLSIARPKAMVSLSNMPKKLESKAVANLPDYVWDIYAESVPMSTYLLAFVVCDFSNISFANFAVWTRQDAISSAFYALSIGPKILKYFEEFFGIKYPLPKMDMIALPDFSAGAMENWGLITYRETAMLYEEGVSAAANKQRVATVVAHELAHQWFGNLVTPSWWSDLWLNEGFASYVEYLGVNAVEPTWKSMDQFVINELQSVFGLDALSSSHQISVTVNHPDEINEIFDRISYAKGATIIRMMDHFLTTDVFRQGLTKYLRDKAFQSAEQDDLWRFLTDAARENKIFDNSTSVKEIMDTWTLQTGFPVVTVTRDYKNRTVALKQERFVYIESVRNHSNPLWWIPVTYTTAQDLNFVATKPSSWMKKSQESSINNQNLTENQWIILNVQQTGYYRVNYDAQNWKLITNHLNDPKTYQQIAPANRAQLIDDALNLARGGYLSYDVALDVTKYLAHERDYVPWKAAINSMNFIDAMLLRTGDYYKFKKYFIGLLASVYNELGFTQKKEDDMLTIYKRVHVLTAACHLGYKNCMDDSIRLFYLWMHEMNPDTNNPISPNLKSLVYCTAIKYGGDVEWEFAWERFLKTSISSEKELLLSAMGCSREAWILTRYLQRSMTEGQGIRKQDVYRVFAAVSNNVIGQPIAFNFIQNNWAMMKEYMGSSMSNLNNILTYSTRRMNTREDLEDLKRFSSQHLKEMGRTVLQALEKSEANIAWMDKNYKTIVNWLGNATITK